MRAPFPAKPFVPQLLGSAANNHLFAAVNVNARGHVGRIHLLPHQVVVVAAGPLAVGAHLAYASGFIMTRKKAAG